MAAILYETSAGDHRQVPQSVSDTGATASDLVPAESNVSAVELDTPFTPSSLTVSQSQDRRVASGTSNPGPEAAQREPVEGVPRIAETAGLQSTPVLGDQRGSNNPARAGASGIVIPARDLDPRQVHNDHIPPADIVRWRGEVEDVLAYFADHNKLRPDPNLYVISGGDGSGKTTLVTGLATYMKENLGLPVTVVRGSGVTGTEALLKWVKDHQGSDSHSAQIIADLERMMVAQTRYSIEDDPGRKIAQGVAMQQMMFDCVLRYLDFGYYVVSDRGIWDAFLGARERVGSREGLAQVAKNFPLLPFGPSVRVRVSPTTAMVRLHGKQEMPPLAELIRRLYEFDCFFARAYPKFGKRYSGVTPRWFMTVSGEARPQQVLDNTVARLVQNGFLPSVGHSSRR